MMMGIVRFNKLVVLVPLRKTDAHSIASNFQSILVSLHVIPEYFK